MQRIVSVQSQLHKRAQQSLAATLEVQQRLGAEERSLLEALGEDSHLHGLFVDQSARHLRQVAVRLSETQRRAEAERTVVREAGLRLKQAETSSDRLVVEHARQEERKALEELALRSLPRTACKPPVS
jgi:hypothetical protein